VAHRTITLLPQTYLSLKRYKVAGKSFDDVIRDLMEEVSPAETYSHELVTHRRRLRRMRKGDSLSRSELRKLLRST
jgi:hypothetical protein